MTSRRISSSPVTPPRLPPATSPPATSPPAAVTGPPLPRPSRLLLAVLLGAAALVHLALAPEHYVEQPAFGAFFAVAGAVQLALALRLARHTDLSWRLLAGVRVTSLSLVAVFIATRLATPPLAPGHGAEPATLLGILTGGIELASVVAVLGLPAATRGTGRAATALWSVTIAVVFAVFFAVASGAVIYSADGWPADVVVPSAALRDTAYLSLRTSRLNVVLTGHLAVTAPVMTFLALGLAAAFLGTNTAIARTAARAGTHDGRPALAAAPAFLAAPACCGVPLLAFLGTGALAALSYYTPVLLFGVAMALSLHGTIMLRGLRLARVGQYCQHVPAP